MTSLPISSIIVDRPNRQRKELQDIPVLAESIRRRGLINAIVVTPDGVLVAGERRLEACKSLGWTHIDIRHPAELDPIELHLIELEENTKRLDLSWQDECEAIAKYHELQQELNPEWSTEDTGAELGLTSRAVNQKLAVQKEIVAGNQRVINAPAFSTARNATARARERKAQEIFETSDKRDTPLVHADFLEYKFEHKFNLIHCDFPYGIESDTHDKGAADYMGGYEDTAGVYLELLEHFKYFSRDHVSESAHLLFWFSMKYYTGTIQSLYQAGWTVNPVPLVWLKSDNAGILPDPNRYPRQICEFAFMASRGDRKIVQAVSNGFAAPTTKEIHMSEKPKEVLRHFFRMLVDDTTVMLDPTCGSGNAVRVAEDLGAKSVLGLEKDEEFYNRAKENYYE